MVTQAIRSAWAEPPASDPTGPRPRDWLLVAALVVAGSLEGALVPDVVWRPVAIALAVAVPLTLPWRRTRPLAMLLIAFGSITVLTVASLVASEPPVGLSSMAFVLVLIYALARWASGRAVLVGGGLLVVPVTLGLYVDWTGVGDAIGGTGIVVAALAFGTLMRKWTEERSREVAQIKLLERERLARELHDTVAHHVSAIVIQAQAGRALAPTQPESAVAALEIIEAAASETLADMRSMVRILRDDEAVELAPQGGVADIVRIADRAGSVPRVEVELSGDLDHLPPSVDAAVYRLAQESITNAVRHARDATHVLVRITGDDDGALRLDVHDDGDTSHLGSARHSGFGLVGMAERARLLGGTCEAGPDPRGGWTVAALLPRDVPR